MRLFREELIAMRSEIREFKIEFSDLRAAMCTVNESIWSIERRMDAVEKQVTESTNYMSTRVMEEAIGDLQCQLRECDQDLLANDVQVSNVPEMPAKNLAHLALLIGVKLGLELDERDVVGAVRMGVRRETGSATGRLRPIAVRLARRAILDDLLRAACVRREVITTDLGLSDYYHRFYVNERLTRVNRQLYGMVCGWSRKAGWKHVRTRGGRTLAQQADGTLVHRIQKESDPDRVSGISTFGTDSKVIP